MDYFPLNDAESLEISYDGPPLDALTLAIFEFEFHQIVQKVVFHTLQQRRLFIHLYEQSADLYPYSSEYQSYFGATPELRSIGGDLRRAPWVRVRINRLTTGSFEQEVTFFAAMFLTNPDVRAILQSLCGNVLYGILNCGIKGIQAIKAVATPKIPGVPTDRFDPFDVGPEVRKIAVAMVENSHGGASSIMIKHKNNGQGGEVEIILVPDDGKNEKKKKDKKK